MELKKFIECFAEQFEETEFSVFQAETKFKELDEWSSLSIIAMIDEEYDVRIKGEEIRNSVTIEDLYNIVKSSI